MRRNPLQPILDRIPAPLRNRYFLAMVLFFAWMIFFDRHDVLTQWRLQKTLDKLKGDKTYYQEKIEEAEVEERDLEENKEKFAREKYYMKKKNEDVYIIEDSKK
ncbi:MAG: hypothetical protein GY705_18125 [Bacteroidetes bacterium]|nr:hypothetical protein [Bacteroidota bacterium]